MDGSSREEISSSGQLEDWAAGVAADLNEDRTEDNAEDSRRPTVDRAVTSPARQRYVAVQSSAMAKRARQQEERDSSPDDENEAKDGSRPKLPRPDKKEPCPRCNSMDTKFCYYNNYNIKQPRFYCKTCQRYWTAGGTLRNIAPGSGRRKSKGKTVGREQGNSPSLADHLTAAAAVAQTSVFGMPMNASPYGSLNPALMAAADPSGLLSPNGSAAAAAYAHPQLLGGHGGLTELKLGTVSSLQAQWGSGPGQPSDLHGSASLREHLQAQLDAGVSMSSSLAHVSTGQQNLGGLDSRLLLSGNRNEELPAAALSLGHPNAHLQPLHQGQSHQGDVGHPPSPSASPPPQKQQFSSPQQPNSQLSQQPSPPQTQQNGSGSDDPDVDGLEVSVQGRRVRLKAELDNTTGNSGYCLGDGGLGLANGGGGGSSFHSTHLAGLTLPPSMASLAAVMGSGYGPGSLGASQHPLLCQQDVGGLVDGAHSGLSRHHLQLVLQQQESLQHLNGLLPQGTISAAALQAQNPLLAGLGHPGVGPSGSTSAAVAAMDPLQRSALLHQAAGLGGAGCWLQGGNSMLPSAAMAAAALESLQSQSLNGSGMPTLLQAPQHSQTSGSMGSAPDWISLAAAAAAACPKPQGPASAAHHSAAVAHQMLHAQAAAAAASGSCGSGAGGWLNSGAFSSMQGGPTSWSSLWPSYNSPASNSFAGYALQAAAAAAFSGGRGMTGQ